MPIRLKIALVFACLWSTASCADDNYAAHPAALQLVDELVAEEGFDRKQLLEVFADAERKESILEAIARPGQTARLRFVLDTPGEYPIMGSTGDHGGTGRIGTLVVVAP